MGEERRAEMPLENLVELFQPRARAIVGYHRIPPEDADDLVQQTFLTYLRRRAEVRNPEAWLAGTLKWRCVMFWRARRKSWLSIVDAAFLDAHPSEPVPPQETVALRCDLERAVARLPEKGRELVGLRYGMGLSHKETAARLGYRYSGIHTITKRCLQALAKEMEGLGWSD